MMSAFGTWMKANRADTLRWTLCFAAVVAVHALGAAALMARTDDSDILPNAPVITIDLAPMPVAPEIVPTDTPVGPQQVETPPEPEPPPPPAKDVSVEPPKPLPSKPQERKKVAKLTVAPTPAEHRAPVAAAPAPGVNAHNSNALPNWKSLLVATLERNKRYPADARARGEQGIAQLAFSVDRNGHVHNARIARSSGSASLDGETLALIQRAAPLPPPPPEMFGEQIAIVVPIRYNIR
jgi:protein TonB